MPDTPGAAFKMAVVAFATKHWAVVDARKSGHLTSFAFGFLLAVSLLLHQNRPLDTCHRACPFELMLNLLDAAGWPDRLLGNNGLVQARLNRLYGSLVVRPLVK